MPNDTNQTTAWTYADYASVPYWTYADYVSVPNGTKRMILRRRDASLLASGGKIDFVGGYIKGGDPACTSLPDGTLPLSDAEVKVLKARYAALPAQEETP
jgi:hypothetical protein